MGKFLNKDNFLIWEGVDGFQDAPFTLDVSDDAVDIVIGATQVQLLPLLNDVASYGFNMASFQFTFQDNPGKPALFDPVTEKITYYPPAGIAVGQVRQLKYRISDMMGNESTEATVNITVQDRPTAWRPYEPSAVCLLDGSGDNTGMKFYNQLEKYYTDTGAAYLPATLKANDSGDVDYVPEARDEITCPLPGAALVYMYLWVTVAGATIEEIHFTTGGSTMIYPGPIDADSDQPRQILVAESYDSIMFRLSGVSGGILSLTTGTGGSGGGNISLGGAGDYTFTAVTMGTDFGADVTIS